MNIQDVLKTIQDLPFAVAIREGENLFPWIECVHVLALVTVIGTISIVDLRLMGLPSHRKSVRKLTQDVLPITWAAFALAAASGFLLFSSRAIKYYSLWEFQAKMVLILLAGINMIVFHIITYRSVHLWDEMADTPRAAKTAGAISLCLWLGVVICGRLIGFQL